MLALPVARCFSTSLHLPHPPFLQHSWIGRRIPTLHFKKKFKMRTRTSPQAHASIEELSHNQVLMAAVTASLLGQMAKPFTSALQGKGFNWKLILTSGGMPSSHSASVAAACTALALERGLADSLFGLSVLFAGIVMYDAQGVRRAVGKQAEVINTMVLGPVPNALSTNDKPVTCNGQYSSLVDGRIVNEIEVESLDDCDLSTLRSQLMALAISSGEKEKSSMHPAANRHPQGNPPFIIIDDNMDKAGVGQEELLGKAKKLPSIEDGQVTLQEVGSLDGWRHIPLKESVGHTSVEVLVGGLWGVLSTLALSQFVVKIGPG